jgi:hypothetical protein
MPLSTLFPFEALVGNTTPPRVIIRRRNIAPRMRNAL